MLWRIFIFISQYFETVNEVLLKWSCFKWNEYILLGFTLILKN